MAMVFDLDELVNMMSIGTLLAYSLVAISVLILRYQAEPKNEETTLINPNNHNYDHIDEQQSLFGRLLNPKLSVPTPRSSRLVGFLTSILGNSHLIILHIVNRK